MAEDFTGGRVTRLISRATESMFQSVALMIFILIPTLTFAAGNVAPQFARFSG
jgi:Mg/Co/Ni transporter MgtE